ncbi:hypothetical protein J4456_05005 [Candidatus Pacearchaeota archaeon]|nr:hypothetical protein [Candidatus Pacearchaeota archaeon]
MLHNIFSKKTKKKSLEKTPIIIADIHERNSLVIAELKSSEIIVETKPLKIADYIIGDIAIERKTVSDLISSMISKRLLQQLTHLKMYPKYFLIIEGDINNIYDEKDNMAKAIRGLIISIITNSNIPIIFSRDYEDTAKYLITLAKQQLKNPTKTSLHSRIPKTKAEQQKYILESFPNIGPKKAEKLLEKFKTLENIFNASEEELKEILKNQASSFKALLK